MMCITLVSFSKLSTYPTQNTTLGEIQGSEPRSEECSQKAAGHAPQLAPSATVTDIRSAKSPGNGGSGGTAISDSHVAAFGVDNTEDAGQGREETAAVEGDLQGGILLNHSKKRKASVSNLGEEDMTKRKLPKPNAAGGVKEALKSILEKHGDSPADLMRALEQIQGLGLSVPPPLD